MIPILNPITFIIRQADIPAIQWIKKNIPESETILINPFKWGYGIYAGNDGGYWISPLAGKKTVPPPVLYGLDNNRDNVLDIVNLCDWIIENKDNPKSLSKYLLTKNIRYIYIGKRGGVLSPHKLAEDQSIELIYYQDGVWIFKIKDS